MLESAAPAILSGRTALILGYEPAVITLEANLLRQIGTVSVVETGDVETALRSLDGVDIVLADPLAGGLNLLERIRVNPALAGLPVMIVTSDTNPRIAIAAKKAGVSGFLVRPYDVDRMTERVTSALQRAAAT